MSDLVKSRSVVEQNLIKATRDLVTTPPTTVVGVMAALTYFDSEITRDQLAEAFNGDAALGYRIFISTLRTAMQNLMGSDERFKLDIKQYEALFEKFDKPSH